MSETVVLGETLTLEDVGAIAHGAGLTVAEAALQRVTESRKLVMERAAGETPVYGVTTGFGALAEVKVPATDLAELQRNLILSHAAGVGRPLSQAETRAMMLLRAQTLATGHSGVRKEVLLLLVEMLNRGVHPLVPEKGSVGASGDLAPLAHLALGMIGEGMCEFDGETMPSTDALARASLSPIVLEAKEGLALVNGTQAMAAVGTLALLRGEALVELADIAGSLTWEGLAGTPEAFDPRIHNARPHVGQIHCAEHLRALTMGSTAFSTREHKRVQDPYSLRCMPQVHGATRDALRYCREVFKIEVNSATDNPLVFSDTDAILSGGNFHGQPLALALDFAAIALAEIGNISERRVEQLVNPTLSGLPPFLVPASGIHSGYMIAQVTAASLVNENKVLATPASIDSIPGSASREDHVSMGMTSARKMREIMTNLQSILVVELLCGAQAVDLRAPFVLGKGTKAAHRAVRSSVPMLERDRYLARDLEAVLSLVSRGVVRDAVDEAMKN